MNSSQENKLEDLLRYLYDHNSYYSGIMKDMGCNPWIDNAVNIYRDIPYMDKKTLLELNDDILTPALTNHNNRFDFTSGTSGTVLKCYKTDDERNALALNIWKQRRKLDSKVRPSNYISIFNKDFEHVIGKFYDSTETNILNLFRRIVEYKPRWISGPVSVFEKMAYLILNGFELDTENLHVIEFMGEFVSHEQRELIERAFMCKTTNNYGAQEVWCMAFECTEHKLHIQDQFCLLDYYVTMKYGSRNELVVTSLNNRLMPILKYRLGDIGTIVNEKCSCGNATDIVILQGGRIGDIIYGTNILGNYFFDQLVWEVNYNYYNAIYAFCVEQISPLVFRFNVVKSAAFCEAVIITMEERMKREIGENIEIKWEFIDSVRFGNNGKLKKFIPYKR